MKFRRVIGIVAEKWNSAAMVANQLEGRELFPTDFNTNAKDKQYCDPFYSAPGSMARYEIHQQISGQVLYLLLAIGGDDEENVSLGLDDASTPPSSGGRTGRNKRGSKERTQNDGANKGRNRRGKNAPGGRNDGQTYLFSRRVQASTNKLRRLVFLCLCSHSMLWVVEPGVRSGISLSAMRSLSALNAVRQRVVSAMNAGGRQALPGGAPASTAGTVSKGLSGPGTIKKGWPGRCQPWLAFVFLQRREDQLPALQEIVTQLMTVCRVNFSSSAKNAAMRTKARCCSFIGESPEMNVEHLKGVLWDFEPSQQQSFSISEWLGAASRVLAPLKMPNDSTGLLGAIRQQQSAKNLSSAASSHSLGNNKKATKDKEKERQRNASTRIAAAQEKCNGFVEGYFRMEEQVQKALCENAFPKAVESYTRGLPPRYTKATHDAHCQRAMAEFRCQAGHKGALCRRYERKIGDLCRRIWHGTASSVVDIEPKKMSRRDRVETRPSSASGLFDRRLCPALSMAGLPCVESQNDCLQGNLIDRKKCSSGVSQLLACACGQSIVERPDPFTQAAANTNFSGSCCDLASSTIVQPNCLWALGTIDPALVSLKDRTITLPGLAAGFNRLEPVKLHGYSGVMVGLEFECVARGARQILAAEQLCNYAYSGIEAVASSSWPISDLDVFMPLDPSLSDISASNMFQFQRVYVLNTGEKAVRLSPNVAFVTGTSSESTFSSDFLILPGQFIVLQAPHSYFQKPACSFVGKRSAARLKAGFLSLEK